MRQLLCRDQSKQISLIFFFQATLTYSSKKIRSNFSRRLFFFILFLCSTYLRLPIYTWVFIMVERGVKRRVLAQYTIRNSVHRKIIVRFTTRYCLPDCPFYIMSCNKAKPLRDLFTPGGNVFSLSFETFPVSHCIRLYTATKQGFGVVSAWQVWENSQRDFRIREAQAAMHEDLEISHPTNLLYCNGIQ